VHINNISDEFKDDLSFGINSLVGVEDNRIKVETLEELADALKSLKNVLEKEDMVFFESIKSVDELDKEINRETRPKDLYCNEISIRPFVGLASAVLNKNPMNLSQIITYIIQLNNIRDEKSAFIFINLSCFFV
jgi:RNA processing factor Prp31